MKIHDLMLPATACLSGALIAGCGGGGADTPDAPLANACLAGSACVTTDAGNGETGTVDGTAHMAQFSMLHSVVVDAESNIHVADYGNNNLTRLISNGGVTTVLAGTGHSSGVGGDSSSASFSLPTGLAFDAEGSLYVADMGNRKIRKIMTSWRES